ncbi:hypothetical protein [Bdellovibrio sp. HCB337]|uniref:hypothetical protein n=1 Tax=Bdellovibrio sp. HCB337 TaxID=3394358 RepID=UPI0039A690D1
MLARFLILSSVLLGMGTSYAGTLKCVGKGESLFTNLSIETSNPLKGSATSLKGRIKFVNSLKTQFSGEFVDAELSFENLSSMEVTDEELQINLNWESSVTEVVPRKIIYFVTFSFPLQEKTSENVYVGRGTLLKYFDQVEGNTISGRFLTPTTTCEFQPGTGEL